METTKHDTSSPAEDDRKLFEVSPFPLRTVNALTSPQNSFWNPGSQSSQGVLLQILAEDFGERGFCPSAIESDQLQKRKLFG